MDPRPQPTSMVIEPVRAATRIGLLGSFRVELSDGRVVDRWTRPPARRLVAILALTPGNRRSREVLAEDLFPGLDATPASRALAKALSMARAALERPSGVAVFSADRTTVGLLTDDLVIDLDVLEGGLRTGMQHPAADRIGLLVPYVDDRRVLLEDDPYEDWALAARERLAALRAEAGVALAQALDSTGARAQDRCQRWKEVTDADPADERAWASRIRAERDTGRIDRALRASYQARAALRDALDAEPSGELNALHDELLAQSAEPAPSTAIDPVRATVGREPILAAFDQLLADLARGHARDLCLIGQAGIGKTHLLDDAVTLAQGRSMLVGRGTSVPEDRRVPYASLRQALHALPLQWIRLKPHLARLLGQDGGSGSLAASRSPRDLALLAEEVIAAVDQLAEDRPVLLVLDDVQWVDPALRVVLERLVAMPPARRWALLTAARSDERAGVARPGLGDVLRVPALDNKAIAEVVRHALPASDGSIVWRAVERSAGNPLFALELARAGPVDVGAGDILPERIAEVIGRRFDQRSAAARRILPILALGDETITNDVILAVMPDEAGLLDVLDELRAASLTQPVEGGLRLAHPLIRDAAASLVNPIRRARIHRRYADAIEGLGAARSELELSGVRHRLSAWEAGRLGEDAGPAALAAWRGAGIADETLSSDASQALLEDGLAAWDGAPPADRHALAGDAGLALVRLGEHALDAGDEARAAACFDRSLSLDLGDEVRAAAWSALGGIPYRHGDMAGAADVYRRGLASLGDTNGVPAATLRSVLGWALWRAGDPDAVALVADSAAVLAERGAPQRASRALDRLAIIATDVDAALDASDRAFVHLQRAADRRELATLLVHRAVIELRAGRLVAALRSSDEALAMFRTTGDSYMESICLWTRADVLDATGDLVGALEARDLEAQLLVAIDNPRNLAGCHAHRASLLRRLARLEEAADASRVAVDAAERSGDPGVLAAARATASGAGRTP